MLLSKKIPFPKIVPNSLSLFCMTSLESLYILDRASSAAMYILSFSILGSSTTLIIFIPSSVSVKFDFIESNNSMISLDCFSYLLCEFAGKISSENIANNSSFFMLFCLFTVYIIVFFLMLNLTSAIARTLLSAISFGSWYAL